MTPPTPWRWRSPAGSSAETAVEPDARSKAALRPQQRRIRRQALLADPQAIARRVATALPSLLQQGSHLGLYWPIGTEPDLLTVAASLRRADIGVALPAVSEGHLLYRPWREGDALCPDDCGIPAPVGPGALPPGQMGLLLAPALAFDRHGIRLGYGGGWFDRLRADPAWRQVPALAVLPAACLCEALPRDPWDVPFDGWLDEHGLHWLQAV